MDCYPMTQRMESEILDLPDPLGPTMAVISSAKVSTVLSGKDLKPWISNAFKYKSHTSYLTQDVNWFRPPVPGGGDILIDVIL